MKKIGLLALALVALFFLASCGAGSSGATSPTVPSSPPISVEYLDGAGDVALDSSFEATFSQPVDTDTVTTSTFFIVATASANIASPIKATYDPAICNSANALAATVSCSSSTVCILDPTSVLATGTQYTACLVPGTGTGASKAGIFFADGTAYSGFKATFTTPSVAPTLIDGKGNSIAASTSGITGVYPNSLRLIFSEAMDTSTVTAANVPFACQGTSPVFAIAPALKTDLTQSTDTFDVTVTDPHLYQLLNCTLDVTTNVKTAAGTSVAAANYAFQSGCAINDTFSTDTQSCWSVDPGAAFTWQTWPDLLANILTYDGADLQYSTAGQAAITHARITKAVSFLSSGFSLTFNVDNPNGFNSGTDYDDVLSVDLRNNENGDINLYLGITNESGNSYVVILFANASTGDLESKLSGVPLTSPAAYSVTVSVDTTNGMQASYTKDGASLPLQPWTGGEFPSAAAINAALLQYAGETWTLSIRFLGEPDLSAVIKSVSTTGFSSGTQY